MLVVDASVLVKVLTREEGTQDARILLAETDIVIAPDFISLEVASALSKKVRYHGLPQGQAMAAMAAMPQFLTTLVPFAELIVPAFNLSLKLTHALQDCLYMALAIDRCCRLATSDRKFVARAGGAGMSEQLLVLGQVA